MPTNDNGRLGKIWGVRTRLQEPTSKLPAQVTAIAKLGASGKQLQVDGGIKGSVRTQVEVSNGHYSQGTGAPVLALDGKGAQPRGSGKGSGQPRSESGLHPRLPRSPIAGKWTKPDQVGA